MRMRSCQRSHDLVLLLGNCRHLRNIYIYKRGWICIGSPGFVRSMRSAREKFTYPRITNSDTFLNLASRGIIQLCNLMLNVVAKRKRHLDATSFKIVQLNLLNAFGDPVEWRWTSLNCVNWCFLHVHWTLLHVQETDSTFPFITCYIN